MVTTGTGSGKTESFLVPLLDHAARAKARGEPGIKAIVLYPMNALVSDPGRRIAEYLHDDARLHQVTAGVYIGGEGNRSTQAREHLVDSRRVLRDEPPDILLTNYKMLDLLLLRAEDAPLWAALFQQCCAGCITVRGALPWNLPLRRYARRLSSITRPLC
ncbi:MAG: DEAD/DEAH box helicase [Pseudonocardiaceae bacterium]